MWMMRRFYANSCQVIKPRIHTSLQSLSKCSRKLCLLHLLPLILSTAWPPGLGLVHLVPWELERTPALGPISTSPRSLEPVLAGCSKAIHTKTDGQKPWIKDNQEKGMLYFPEAPTTKTLGCFYQTIFATSEAKGLTLPIGSFPIGSVAPVNPP